VFFKCSNTFWDHCIPKVQSASNPSRFIWFCSPISLLKRRSLPRVQLTIFMLVYVG